MKPGFEKNTRAALFEMHHAKAASGPVKRFAWERIRDPERMTKIPTFPGAGRKRILDLEKGSKLCNDLGGRWAIVFKRVMVHLSGAGCCNSRFHLSHSIIKKYPVKIKESNQSRI
jgi:hypothetical protein